MDKLEYAWPDRRRKLEVWMCTGGILHNARLKLITDEWRWEYVGGSYAINSDDEWGYYKNPALPVRSYESWIS